jgi:hypothetical protein
MPIPIRAKLLDALPFEWIVSLTEIVLDYLIVPTGTFLYRETQVANPEKPSPGCGDRGFVQISGMDIVKIQEFSWIMYDTKAVQVVKQSQWQKEARALTRRGFHRGGRSYPPFELKNDSRLIAPFQPNLPHEFDLLDDYYDPSEETGYVIEMDLNTTTFPNAPAASGNVMWRVFPPWGIGMDYDDKTERMVPCYVSNSIWDPLQQYKLFEFCGRPKRDPWEWAHLE